MISLLKYPTKIRTNIEAHKQWLNILEEAQSIIDKDVGKEPKSLRIKERYLPPEVLGRSYAQYCNLINKLYDAYLNSVHLQRAPYILELVSVFLKRLYELRNELVYLIVNDYIYVDAALTQLKMTPYDIQIVVPYHFPLEYRSDSMEYLLQKMWSDAFMRKNAVPVLEKPPPQSTLLAGSESAFHPNTSMMESFGMKQSAEDVTIAESVPTIIPEEFVQANIIQRCERYRQYYMADFRAKCNNRRLYIAQKVEDAPLEIRSRSAAVIQKVYREFMEIKRKKIKDSKRDMLLGLIPDPDRQRLDYEEENNKLYERRRQQRSKIQEVYLRELEQENTRLLFKKEDQLDDITDQVREWFREWFYGYGFFPEYPYPVEGGTIMVIRGDYPTIAEKIEADEKYLEATKGKTKEQLKQEQEQAQTDAAMRANVAKEAAKKEAEQEFKLKCNPFTDPGYPPKKSEFLGDIIAALQKYRASWSIYDNLPPEQATDAIYGYMSHLITEDLMSKIHKDCRIYVDELMKLDLKLLIQAHQQMYKNVGKKYPKMQPRRKPKAPLLAKTLNIDNDLLKSFEEVFDLGIVTKPTSKIKDIIGDLNYGAYDSNLRDPDAVFPLPGYGDVKSRLLLSCVFGSGMAPGATRNRAVMLLGPERHGKSFLVDCVAGDMNAIKIDITPEVFSAVSDKPAKILTQVFLVARAFQPAVIYMRNIEKVFAKKVPPQDKHLNAKTMKTALVKLVKSVVVEDSIIFIATCSAPYTAQVNPMVSMFNEVILVPRTDYNTLHMFFYNQLQSIQSIPRDYCVQALAQILQGYAIGIVIQLYHEVMNPERIVRLNINPLSPSEFLEPLIEKGIEPLMIEDYQDFVTFYIENSALKGPRDEFNKINLYRAVVYKKFGQQKQ